MAAVASFLEARRQNGRWLLRIEDIDPPRAEPGADSKILRALEAFGFEWDGAVILQSQSDPEHRMALQRLLEAGLAYHCGCSRRDLADAPRGPLGTIYPGTCRNGTAATETAVRLRTGHDPIRFRDGLQGLQSQDLANESGDFIILRRDGLIAYQLAVAVDDHLQGITEIVRGIDLMDSTARQIHVQHCLGYETPRYQHIPVAVHTDGDKLSKLTGASGIPLRSVESDLLAALRALQQAPPVALKGASREEIWTWASHNWDIGRMAGLTAVLTDQKAIADGKNPLR
jgi:glutamyl-Q tRNA(Asp) synthetase